MNRLNFDFETLRQTAHPVAVAWVGSSLHEAAAPRGADRSATSTKRDQTARPIQQDKIQ